MSNIYDSDGDKYGSDGYGVAADLAHYPLAIDSVPRHPLVQILAYDL